MNVNRERFVNIVESYNKTVKHMRTFKELFYAVRYVFKSYFPSDTELVSPEVKKILANPENRKKYLNAVEKLSKGSPMEEVKLEDGSSMTLVS